MSNRKDIVLCRRVTSTLLRAVPDSVIHFDAILYAVVPRAKHAVTDGPWGADVRLEPCELDWKAKSIRITIPRDVNPGVSGPDDLDSDFFESVQAAFLNLISCAVR